MLAFDHSHKPSVIGCKMDAYTLDEKSFSSILSPLNWIRVLP